ncbi:hypothetical protein FBY35_6011 [Streptomyces sp. SLBN-118]|uniref:DUF6192 family protein n=1 Tax=Streptomyces sp. SLBN-118 TaxID=2768454 RepID=UPI001150A133|nr:DUF6192 family protein [Streptomyces sp. SLBN-118]TQK44503.1 hypothetical protein FBY35_6011 [Streptomyces sp. SLBN-118]
MAVTDKVGSVSRQRYKQIAAELRDVVQQQTRGQWLIGDRALEIEPMQFRCGQHEAAPGEELRTVREALFMLAEDIGLSYRAVEYRRWTASRFPKNQRLDGISYTVYRTLAHIEDEGERFGALTHPPLDKRTGQHRWTPDAAKRQVGHQVARPVTPQEKINAIHTLAREEDVAGKVTTEMLHRPDVAFRAMTDDTARHQVNRAQVERGRQAREDFERTSPVAPTVKRIDHAIEFLDLVSACHSFVANAGRVVPRLRDRQLNEDERTVVHSNVARVRATLEWIETAVDTGEVGVDEELARLLKGE